mgnify:CR=1 FL=1
MMRIGHGFDVHAFGSGDHVILGGEKIAHSAGLVAHSDGDVVLHALCDALLGAAGLGDIDEGFWAIRRRWEGLSDLLNCTVQVDLNPGTKVGTVSGLDDDGALRLQLEGGQVERILAGDVRIVE